jgi:hypothetical protein
LTEFKNLAPQTEKLHKEKAKQIESRIQQFEQLAQALPEVIESANALDTIRQQKNVLLRNLDQAQETPLYQSLVALQQKIEKLEEFFEQLRELETMPRRSSEELNAIESQIANIETVFASWLSPQQVKLLTQKKQQIGSVREQEAKKAQQWLADLATSYKNGAKLDELLHIAQTPPAFLSLEDTSRLEQVKQQNYKGIEKDNLLKIETLFKNLDADARRECIQRLQNLMDKS